jgi:hypothetical protein
MSLTIKNYKQLEGWAHDYKDLRIGTIYETSILYSFNVVYNSIHYIIKIFREANVAKHYRIELRDGMDMNVYGTKWVSKELFEKDKITDGFEILIIHNKPKARQTTGNTNFNNPF